MFDIGDIVAIAIQIEENGEQTYRQAAQQAENPAVARLLNELADDEARHRAWFADIRDRIISKGPPSAELEAMGKGLLRDMLKDQNFSLQDTELATVDTQEEIFAVAMAFEEDTVLFYQMLGSFIEDERTWKELEGVVEEEKKHIRLLQDRLGTIAS